MPPTQQDPPTGGKKVKLSLRRFHEALSDEALADAIERMDAVKLFRPDGGYVSNEALAECEMDRSIVSEFVREGKPGARTYALRLIRESRVKRARAKRAAQAAQLQFYDSYANAAAHHDAAETRSKITRSRTVCAQPIAHSHCEQGRARQSKPSGSRATTRTSASKSPSGSSEPPDPAASSAVFTDRDLRQLLELALETLPDGSLWEAWQRLAREIRRRLKYASGGMA